MRTRFLLVYNPLAGRTGSRLHELVRRELEAQGATVRLVDAGSEPLERSLRSNGSFDAVIAAGGDGTFRAVATEIRAMAPIGLIPAGTGNVLAHEIGMPRRVEKIADVLMRGPVASIEGATANGEPFFLMAGAGFDGDVIGRLNQDLKQKLGKAAYAGPVLGALAARQPRLEVEIDGCVHAAGWVVVTNARHYGGSFVITPGAGISEPGLVAVLFKSQSRLVRLGQLLALAAGRLGQVGSVERLHCRRIAVRCDGPCAVEVDGDPFAPAPLAVEAGGPRVELIVPPEFLEDCQARA